MRTLVFVWFGIIVLCLCNSVFASVKNKPAVLKTDTSKIDVRRFDEAAIGKFREDKNFQYTTEDVQKPSWWNALWAWIWAIIREIYTTIFGGLSFNPNGSAISIILKILEYIVFAGIIVLVVYFIFKAAGIDLIGLWKRQPKKISVPYNESLENIHEISFDQEIEKALSQHNYRLAVRLLYLKSLKQLSDAQLIQWQIDKTNSAYLYEISNPSQKETFGILTRQFEYIWYGNFPIDQRLFGNINLSFQSFKNQLS